jgi:hypothetical protein
LILQCEFSRCHAREASFLFPESGVSFDEFLEPNETKRPHNIPYSPYDLMKWRYCERFPAVEESDQHHFIYFLFFLLLRSSFCLCWRAYESAITYFGFLFWDHTGKPGLITRYYWVKQAAIIIHRLNTLLTSWQSEGLLFICETVRNKPSAYLPFSESFHCYFENCFSDNFESLFHQ